MGWDLALTSTVILDSVSLIFYILQVIPTIGMFPEWFFVKWAQLDRLNRVIFSKVYFIIMLSNVYRADDSTFLDIFRLISYVGVSFGINLLQK